MSTPKTKHGSRSVSLGEDVIEVLEEHKNNLALEFASNPARGDSTLMFPSEVGTLYRPDNVSRLRKQLIESARAAWLLEAKVAGDTQTVKKLESHELLPVLRMHDFRHLHVSILIRQGHNPKAVADRIGHSRASFTMDKYAHLFNEQREELALNLREYLN